MSARRTHFSIKRGAAEAGPENGSTPVRRERLYRKSLQLQQVDADRARWTESAPLRPGLRL